MPIVTLIYRLEYMDLLIRTRSTGTPAQFAQKIGISRRCLFLWIDQLREDFNFPIEYDKKSQTYYYTRSGKFWFGFVPKEEIFVEEIMKSFDKK